MLCLSPWSVTSSVVDHYAVLRSWSNLLLLPEALSGGCRRLPEAGGFFRRLPEARVLYRLLYSMCAGTE